MEAILPMCLFCGWHLLVLGVGVWIGHSRPWRWRIVREGDYAASPTAQTNARPYYDEEDVFETVRR